MNKLYDIIIIGAGPAGLSAAICAARAKLRTLVLDNGKSGISRGPFSNVLNYPGIPRITNVQLMKTMRAQAEDAGAEICADEATNLDLTGEIKTVFTETGEYRAIALIAATGVQERRLDFPGEEEFTGHGVTYNFTYDGSYFEEFDIIVAGSSQTAVRQALFLSWHARRVLVLVPGDALDCSQAYLNRVMERSNIELFYHTKLSAVSGDKLPRKAVILDTKAELFREIHPQAPASALQVFVFNGYTPNTTLFQGRVELDQNGFMATDETMQCNLEGVFAAGDVRPKPLRQLATAVSDGSVSAFNAVSYVHAKKHDLNIQVAPPSGQQKTLSSKYFDQPLLNSLMPVLGKMEHPVLLRLILSDNPVSDEMREFLFDFSALDARIQVECLLAGENPEKQRAVGTDLYPVIAVLSADGTDHGIYFHGVPTGHEFTSFVLAIYNVAGPGQEIAPGTLQAIRKLAPHDIIIGVSLTCTVCPDSVQAAHLLALHNPGIRAHMVDLYQYTSVRENHRILSVPAMIIDGSEIIFGRKRLEDMVEILAGIEKRTRS